MSATQAVLDSSSGGGEIRSRSCPSCYVCGAAGTPLYEGLKDRLFEAPGTWNLKQCPDSGCGLVWLDPMPIEEDIGKAYTKYYTHQENSDPFRDFLLRVGRPIIKGYLSLKYHYRVDSRLVHNPIWGGLMYLLPGIRAAADHSVFYLNAQPSGRLLDVGFGTGSNLRRMQELGWQVEGVDVDENAVRNARAKGLRVHLGSVAEQKFPDNTFEAVTMSHVIEHVPNPIGLLRECYRILKPGGRLLVVTPNASSWGHRLYADAWLGLEPPRHLHIFSGAPLRATLMAAGFGKIHLSTTIRGANTLFIASRLIRRTSRFEMSANQPWSLMVWGQAMQIMEWAYLKVNPQAGEEIAVIARKGQV